MSENTFIDIDNGLKVTRLGNVRTVEGTDVIKQAIKTILSTIPGERVRRPEFGCKIYTRLFEPVDSEIAEDIQEDIIESLSTFEPRINLQQILVEPEYDNNKYRIEIYYYDTLNKKTDYFNAAVKAYED